MIAGRLLAGGALAAGLAALAVGPVAGRAGRRLLAAPRTTADEARLRPAVDALGGEVVRVLARDGVRLAARWLPPESSPVEPSPADGAWVPRPDEAILLLHGYSGSIAPDLVEYAPFLRRTAAVLGLDFRGHGGSDDGPTTFGLLETEDVAGALAWLGGRGVARVALVGSSMGGITAIAATAILGDGTLASADHVADAPAAPRAVTPPRIVAIVADSVTPELRIVVERRIAGPAARPLARLAFAGAARRIGGDPRAIEPIRMLSLLEDVPVLLVHGEADTAVPVADGRRLAAAGGPATEHWVVAGAEHARAHALAPVEYEARVTAFVRRSLAAGRP